MGKIFDVNLVSEYEIMHEYEEREALEKIYNDLLSGIDYGKDFDFGVRYPYFDTRLWITKNKQYIGFSHYGSSHQKTNIKNLLWILFNIFGLSPEEFLSKYITREQSKFDKLY